MRVLQGLGAEQMRFLWTVVVYVIYVRVKENPRRPMSWSTTSELEKDFWVIYKHIKDTRQKLGPQFQHRVEFWGAYGSWA